MILDNPFRQLGLSADSSVRDIRRRSEELKLAIDLGREKTLTEFDLTRARQELEDPVKRFGHELTWIHVPSDIVDPRIDFDLPLSSLPVEPLRNLAGSAHGDMRANGTHALAVVLLGAFFAAPRDVDLQEALTPWSEVCESTDFWDFMTSRALAAGDPRLTRDAIVMSRDALPSKILEPVAALGASALEAGENARAKAIIRAIRTSGLPADSISAACKQVSARRRSAIETGIAQTGDAVRRVPTAEGQTAKVRGAVIETEAILIADVLRPHTELRALDPTEKDVELSDEVAEITRRVGARATYDLDGWQRAYLLMDQAMGLAGSDAAAAKYAIERAEVRLSLHDFEADAAIEQSLWISAAAHLELASEYAGDDEAANSYRARASGARSEGHLSEESIAREKAAIDKELTRAAEHLTARIAGTSTESFVPRKTAEPQPASTAAAVSPSRVDPIRTSPPKKGNGRALVGLLGVGVLAIIAAAAFGLSTSTDGASTANVDSPASADAADSSDPTVCDKKQNALGRRVDRAESRLSNEGDRLDSENRVVLRGKRQINREFPSKTLSPSEYQRYLPYRDRESALIDKYNHHVDEYRLHKKQLSRLERRFTKLSQSDSC